MGVDTVLVQQASLPIDGDARVRLLARAPMNTKVTRVRLECLNLPLPTPTYTVNLFTVEAQMLSY